MKEKSSIIDYAKSIGIEYIGFTDTLFTKDFIERLKYKRENNLLSGFEEENENIRVNIENILNGAKSIISIGIPYKYKNQDYKNPYVSKYTMGKDYHLVLLDKLNLIKNYIENNFNEKCEVFCDTGVLCDKEIARKAGIGFQGKNTNIITERHGSYIFLGEVVTTLFLEPSLEKHSLCKSCNKCILACPAKAIDFTGVNGKKCLSYISQKKDDLTEEEMDTLGLRIFGCDTCQDVCPYNEGVEKSKVEEFIPYGHLINIDFKEIFEMTNKEFKRKYGVHALAWRGKYIIQRNIIVAMGNSKNKDYIKFLENKLWDPRLQKYVNRSMKKLMDL